MSVPIAKLRTYRTYREIEIRLFIIRLSFGVPSLRELRPGWKPGSRHGLKGPCTFSLSWYPTA